MQARTGWRSRSSSSRQKGRSALDPTRRLRLEGRRPDGQSGAFVVSNPLPLNARQRVRDRRPRIPCTSRPVTDAPIDSGDGADTVNVGGGDKKIFLRGESDTLTAGDGNDTIDSGEGADTVLEGGGNNEIWLRGGNDQVIAGAGNDTINGGAGMDTCDAGGGVKNVTLCEL